MLEEFGVTEDNWRDALAGSPGIPWKDARAEIERRLRKTAR